MLSCLTPYFLIPRHQYSSILDYLLSILKENDQHDEVHMILSIEQLLRCSIIQIKCLLHLDFVLKGFDDYSLRDEDLGLQLYIHGLPGFNNYL